MALERSRLGAVLSLLVFGGGFLILSILSSEHHQGETRSLKPGLAVTRELSGGEAHFYRVSIEPGHAFRITLDPHRQDFTLSLRDPFRTEGLHVDTRHGLHGPEILFVADLQGTHILEVRSQAPVGMPAQYELSVGEPKPVSKEDRLRAAAMAAFSRGEQLFSLDDEEAGGSYRKSLELWQRVGEAERETATRYRLGRSLQNLGEWNEALRILQPALQAVRGRRDRLAEACLLDRMGRSFYETSNPTTAAELYSQSLDLFRLQKYRPGEADVLNNLGLVYTRGGNFLEGITLIVQGLKIWEELGGLSEQVYIRQNLGELYLGMGEPDKALDQFKTALKISAGQRELHARALGGIGGAHVESGHVDLAIPELTQAVDLWRDLGNRRWEGVNLVRLGEAYVKKERLAEAREVLEEALALSRVKPVDDRVQGMALGNLGHVLDLQNQPGEAIAYFDQARTIYERGNEPGSVVRVLRGRTEAALHLKDLDAALKTVQEAITIVERLRSPLPTDFSLRRYLYDLYVETLMRLHEREPDKSYAIAAFNAAEAARSRSLLEDVKVLQADFLPGDPGLMEEKADLEETLTRLEMRRLAMSKGRASEEPGTEEIDRRIRDIETSLGLVRTKLEGRGLAGSPRALTLPEVQRSLDSDTLLLAYFLGAERSWLWEVKKDSFMTHELAKRSAIEEQAKEVHNKLARPRGWQTWKSDLAELSRMLLSKVANRMEERQLLISPDGALYLTPFAALLDPRTLDRAGQPGGDPGAPRFLVFDHRLVTIPSISVVAATRDALSTRRPAQKGIAILAAPDFQGSNFKPLDYSRKEGEAIARVAPPGQSFLATGFQASRSTAMDPKLREYNLLHFATHGWLRDRPDLSGIALSFRDEHGQPLDGFLRAFEIYDLKLSADLVVLSACETAIGGEEGGLVRAFLHAGSKRVMATLWKVSDRSTPRFMESFYQGLLHQGMAPSAALQQAQIEMLESPWKAPHYWAGFMLQGDWH